MAFGNNRFLDHRGKEILKIYEKAGKTKEAALFKKQLEHARVKEWYVSIIDFNLKLEGGKKTARKNRCVRLQPTHWASEVCSREVRVRLPQLEFRTNLATRLDLQDETIKNELKKIQAQNLKDIRAWSKYAWDCSVS
mgnify:CR=1 FL=1